MESGLTELDNKVFNALKAIMIQNEFQTATTDFYAQYCGQFSEDDENKLEYTTIFNEFVKIVDNVLEAQIKERGDVSQEEINEFCQSIKDNSEKVKQLEAIDKDIVDGLFSFINFDDFKKQMIQAKVGQAKGGQTAEETSASLGSDVKIAQNILGTTYKEFEVLFNEDLSKWKQKHQGKEKDFKKKNWKCDIHQRPVEGIKSDMLRIDAVLKNIRRDGLKDFFSKPADSSMIKEQKIIEEHANGDLVLYLRMKMPMMSDRDNVSLIHMEDVGDQATFLLATTIEHEKVPPVKGVVRMFFQVNGFLRPDPNDDELTHYTEIDIMDMKGYMPARLMNMALASETVKEFQKFYDANKLPAK